MLHWLLGRQAAHVVCFTSLRDYPDRDGLTAVCIRCLHGLPLIGCSWEWRCRTVYLGCARCSFCWMLVTSSWVYRLPAGTQLLGWRQSIHHWRCLVFTLALCTTLALMVPWRGFAAHQPNDSGVAPRWRPCSNTMPWSSSMKPSSIGAGGGAPIHDLLVMQYPNFVSFAASQIVWGGGDACGYAIAHPVPQTLECSGIPGR